MLKLPDFMRIDPNDFNAENIRRMSSYGKPQEDFLTGAVQQFQNSALFKERKVAREYFENETEIDNKIRFYFNREGLQIIDNTVSNVKLRHSFYRKLVNQKVNYLLSKAFTIKCKNEEFEQILQMSSHKYSDFPNMTEKYNRMKKVQNFVSKLLGRKISNYS